MAKRLKTILSIFLIAIVLIAVGSTQLWRIVTPQQEQVLEISDNTLVATESPGCAAEICR